MRNRASVLPMNPSKPFPINPELAPSQTIIISEGITSGPFKSFVYLKSEFSRKSSMVISLFALSSGIFAIECFLPFFIVIIEPSLVFFIPPSPSTPAAPAQSHSQPSPDPSPPSPPPHWLSAGPGSRTVFHTRSPQTPFLYTGWGTGHIFHP